MAKWEVMYLLVLIILSVSRTDRQTNIKAIAWRFILKNARTLKKFLDQSITEQWDEQIDRHDKIYYYATVASDKITSCVSAANIFIKFSEFINKT